MSPYKEFQNYRQLFELFPEPVIIGELTGKILCANRAAEVLFGYTKEEITALSVFDLVTGEFTHRMPDILKDESCKQDLTFPMSIRSKNEEVIPCEIKTSLLRHDDRSLRCIVFHDLSVKLEEKAATLYFAENIEKKTSFIPSTIEEPEMVFELDNSGHFISANNLCTEKTGYTKNDLKKGFQTLVPEDRARAMIDFSRLLRGEKLNALEYTVIKKDGSLMPVIVSLRKIMYKGTILGVRVVSLDFSEHKRIEKELILKEKLSALGEMASGVVHDINNILTIILGNLKLFPQSGLDESSRGIIDNIKRVALDGTEIIKRIKNYSHIGAQPSDEFYDMNCIILDVIEFLKPRWNTSESGISVITKLDDIPHVRITPYEIREVLSNIIINSLDAMPNGGNLTIRSFLENDHITVCVEDTGTGMSEETKKHVFELFYTTKKTRGTGIGMFVSYEIIKNLGGEMLVESDEFSGTRITILLPGLLVEKSSLSTVHDKDSLRKQWSILVIDDEENICKILHEYLKRDGYEVVTALSGEQGMALFREKCFDIVITDLNIPDFTGWDIARHIQKERSDTFIILLTGWETKIDDFNNREKNIDVVLQKPIDFARLSDIIRQACAKN
ncbi:MAG: PAS domain S-box protein [Candidatus Latescibacterota bacterium]